MACFALHMTTTRSSTLRSSLGSCAENVDFLSWLLGEVDEAASPHTWERAQQVRRLVPTNPR